MLRDTIPKRSGGTSFNQTSDGILLFFDSGRTKWLSTARETFVFGINHKNLTSERYMLLAGKLVTSATGIRIPRNATITSITVQTKNSATGTFRIRKNDISSDLATLTLTSEQGKSQSNLSIDLDKDDWIQILMSPGAGQIDYPVLNLEMAWRT